MELADRRLTNWGRSTIRIIDGGFRPGEIPSTLLENGVYLRVARFAIMFWAFQGEAAKTALDVKASLIE